VLLLFLDRLCAQPGCRGKFSSTDQFDGEVKLGEHYRHILGSYNLPGFDVCYELGALSCDGGEFMLISIAPVGQCVMAVPRIGEQFTRLVSSASMCYCQ
jgi:hypothetical protein